MLPVFWRLCVPARSRESHSGEIFLEGEKVIGKIALLMDP